MPGYVQIYLVGEGLLPGNEDTMSMPSLPVTCDHLAICGHGYQMGRQSTWKLTGLLLRMLIIRPVVTWRICALG